jgi:hypothetical protein
MKKSDRTPTRVWDVARMAFVRGAAAAMGGGLVSMLVWWIQQHH